MVCKNCYLFDQEKPEVQCCFFKDRHSLALFLLNVILNTQKKCMDYCKCDDTEICLICRFDINYREHQYIICKNCLNLDFLAQVRENLHENLLKLVELHNHFLCEIINEKFQYSHNDWFNGNKAYYDLEKCLSYWEKYQMGKIIKNDFKIFCKKIVVD